MIGKPCLAFLFLQGKGKFNDFAVTFDSDFQLIADGAFIQDGSDVGNGFYCRIVDGTKQSPGCSPPLAALEFSMTDWT